MPAASNPCRRFAGRCNTVLSLHAEWTDYPKKVNAMSAEPFESSVYRDTVSVFIEMLPDPAFLVDKRGALCSLNNRLLERLGCSAGECVGADAVRIIGKDPEMAGLMADFANRRARVARDGKKTVFSDTVKNRTWRTTINPICSGEAVVFLLIVFKEIDEPVENECDQQRERVLKTSILDAMPGCVVALDEKGQLILSNSYALDLVLGEKSGKAKAVDPKEVLSAEVIFPVSEKFRNLLESGIEDSSEVEMHPPGRKAGVWLATRGKRITINNQTCVVAIGVDITQQKKVQAELFSVQKKLNQSLEAARAGVWEYDLITRGIIWSDELWKLLGLPKKQGKPSIRQLKSLLHSSCRMRVVRSIAHAVKLEQELNVECRVATPNGVTRWLMMRGKPLQDDKGKTVSFIGTAIDITERKQLEEELKQSKLRYSYALDAAHSGIWEWDVKTDRLSWSSQIWGLYGLEEDSVALTRDFCVQTVHPDDREMASGIIRSSVSKETEALVEYRVVHPDGSVHWLTSMGMPLRDADGRITRYIGTIKDITDRKKVELELVESRKRLNQALEAARAGVWEWDLKTGENVWSEEVWGLYGLELGGLPPSFDAWIGTIHPDDVDNAVKTVRAAAKSETELNVEYRVRYADGSIHWLMSRGKPVRDEKGQTRRYIGTVIDITVRKEMEQQLVAAKQRFTFALEATNAGVWEWDLKTDRVYWSERIWELYGLEPGSLPMDHKLCQSTVHPRDKETTFQTVMSAASQEREINVEYRVCHSDGTVHWLACRGMPQTDPLSGMSRYVGTVMEITRRKEIDNALKESESKFRSIFDHSPVAINIEEIGTGRMIDANASWLQLFEFNAQEIIGKTLTDLGMYADITEYENILLACRNHEKVNNKPLRLRKRSGELLNVLYSSEFITLQDRHVLLVMMTDITLQTVQQQNINMLEQAVAERTKQLQHEVERLQRFLSMISHEYRTPLAIIRTNLDLIKMKNKMGDHSNKDELFKINRAIDRLVEVLEESIQKSRISESQSAARFQAFRIEPAVSSQIELLRNMWPEITLVYSETLGASEVLGEVSQMKIAVFNLLDNARKYSLPDTPIEVECYCESGEAVVKIRNRARAIKQHEAEKCFEQYHRGSNSVNTAGAGLGLWLVRKVIFSHKGTVVMKVFPAGVELTVRLPLVKK